MDLMLTHDYMKGYVHERLGHVIARSHGSRRAVYLAMLLLAYPTKDDGFVCAESQSLIAMLAGVTQVTANRALKDLEELGLIEVSPPAKPGQPWRRIQL